jgi:hypothetical protein
MVTSETFSERALGAPVSGLWNIPEKDLFDSLVDNL